LAVVAKLLNANNINRCHLSRKGIVTSSQQGNQKIGLRKQREIKAILKGRAAKNTSPHTPSQEFTSSLFNLLHMKNSTEEHLIDKVIHWCTSSQLAWR
jgi:hypothetical protein